MNQPQQWSDRLVTQHEQQPEVTPNTCVLLAPGSVDVGKHVTDAVRQGGWVLLRIENAVNAMATLCRLEQQRRSAKPVQSSRHMLLIHREMHVDENGALQAAVRKHLAGVRVHEIQSTPAAAPGSAPAGTGTAAVAPHAPVEDDSPIVGRIGRAASTEVMAEQVARRALQLAEEANDAEVDDDVADKPLTHEVSRDEISMLLEDERPAEDRP